MYTLSIDYLVLALAFTSWGYYVLTYLLSFCLRKIPGCGPSKKGYQFQRHRYSIMIPALNERNVIKNTLRRINELDYPSEYLEVLLINDGSDDGTDDCFHEVLKEMGESEKPEDQIKFRFMILNVPPAIARMGKGEALNRGYRHLQDTSGFANQTPTPGKRPEWDWIICVIDADGWPDKTLLQLANRKFAYPQVGAVNSSIRIRNRDAFITKLQDMEFYVVARFLNYVRGIFMSNSFMGGNGQFMRAQVLDELFQQYGHIWFRESLVEDLDIGLRIWKNGWKTKQIFTGFVHQQGVKNVCLLIRQRGRWAWGNVQVFFKFILGCRLCCCRPRCCEKHYGQVRQNWITIFDCFMVLSNWLYAFLLFPTVVVITVLYLLDVLKPVFSFNATFLWVNGLIWLAFPFLGMWLSRDYSPWQKESSACLSFFKMIPKLILRIKDTLGYAIYVTILFPLLYQAVWRVITCQKPRWAKTSREVEEVSLEAPPLSDDNESSWDYHLPGHKVVLSEVEDGVVMDIVSVNGDEEHDQKSHSSSTHSRRPLTHFEPNSEQYQEAQRKKIARTLESLPDDQPESTDWTEKVQKISFTYYDEPDSSVVGSINVIVDSDMQMQSVRSAVSPHEVELAIGPDHQPDAGTAQV